MAPRPFWTGYLKLSLVTRPVALTPATSDAERVRFHTLNRKTGNCVVSRYVDTWQPVDDASQVKGYARDEGSFVLLEEDELQGLCHVAVPRARSVGTSGIVRPPRQPSATWSSRHREARGAFGRR